MFHSNSISFGNPSSAASTTALVPPKTTTTSSIIAEERTEEWTGSDNTVRSSFGAEEADVEDELEFASCSDLSQLDTTGSDSEAPTPQPPPMPYSDDRFEKLNLLLEKTAIYSQFLSEQLAEDTEKLSDSSAQQQSAKSRKRKQAPSAEESSKKLKNIMGMPSSSKNDTTTRLQPSLVNGGVLRDYQLAGVNWLISLYENGVNGILADEMGLGKTIQTISIIAHLCEHGVNGPFLVVAPLSTIANWKKEFNKWVPSINVVLYHGTRDERAALRQQNFDFGRNRQARKPTKIPASPMPAAPPSPSPSSSSSSSIPVPSPSPATPSKKPAQQPQPDFPTPHKEWTVVITSYELSINDRKYLDKFTWKYLVVDEAHRLKNFNCRLINELRKLRSENRLLLTGTPIQNNLAELWSLLNFLLPDIFDDLKSFQSWFDFSEDLSRKGGDKVIIVREQQSQLISKLHNILRPFMLRRLKTEISLEIPQKRELLLYAPMTPKQREYYVAIKNRDFAVLKGQTDGGSTSRLLNILMQLRKVCNHPALFSSFTEEDENEIDYTTPLSLQKARLETNVSLINEKRRKDLISNAGKLNLLDRMLERLKSRGHKVLIFSQMVRMLDILEEYVQVCGYQYCRIDGHVKQADRERQITTFNSNPDVFCFLLSTRAGGLGINLTAADTVVIYDSDWNPQMDLQAQDRCHRIGQTKPVVVYRLVTVNSVEKKILERATSKLKLERLVIQKGNFKGIPASSPSTPGGAGGATRPTSITAQELLDILSADASPSANGLDGAISDKDLECVLDRSFLFDLSQSQKTAAPHEAATDKDAAIASTSAASAGTTATPSSAGAGMIAAGQNTAAISPPQPPQQQPPQQQPPQPPPKAAAAAAAAAAALLSSSGGAANGTRDHGFEVIETPENDPDIIF